MAILHITSENFETEVLNSSVPTLVDFWASWCGPCKMLAPVLETVDAEVASFAKVCKLNVDDEPTIAARYGIMSIPTMIFSAYGMNLKSVGMPFADNPMGFLMVILLSLVFSILVAIVFRKKDLF